MFMKTPGFPGVFHFGLSYVFFSVINHGKQSEKIEILFSSCTFFTEQFSIHTGKVFSLMNFPAAF
jgi:hypothetical protein